MSIDATPLGELTAVVMDDLHAAVDRGDIHDATIVSCLVVVETTHADGDDGRLSTVIARATDDRSVIGIGLAQRALEALLRPGD